jgi:hypothetical protein
MLISSIDIYTMYLLYYLYSNLIRLRKEIWNGNTCWTRMVL